MKSLFAYWMLASLAIGVVEAQVGNPPFELFNHYPGRLFSGSEPVEVEDYAYLKNLGIVTIVSVDGAKPDVEAAKKLGMRYVHLPIGYDGVPAETQAALRNLLKETDGKIFIHCHHGKHRGPAAASIAAMLDGAANKEKSLELMKTCGTSEDYTGLWKDVREFAPPAPDAKAAPLVEIAETGSLTDSMVTVDEIFDYLTALQKNGWKPDPKHPDVVAPQQALLLHQQYRESARLQTEAKENPDLAKALAHSEGLALALHEALKKEDFVEAEVQFKAVASDCKACHKEHRN